MHAFAISLAFTLAMEADLEGQLSAYPPREVVEAQVRFARLYGSYLSNAPDPINLRNWVGCQMEYVVWSYPLWVKLKKSQDKGVSLQGRMEYLDRLKKELLGTQGRMPPIIAIWNFREGPPPPPPSEKPPIPKAG
jgi:hypothetical protein